MGKLVLVLISTLLFSSSGYAAKSVNMLIGDWAPYTSKTDKDGKIAEKLVNKAFELVNIKVNYKYYPWKRSYFLVKSGKGDGTFPWSKTDERSKEFIISKEPLVNETEVFFHLKNFEFDWKTPNDLKGYKIGGTSGYSHVKQLEDFGFQHDVTTEEIAGFKKLLAGRIKLFPANIYVGYNLIHQNFPAEKAALFTNHPKPLNEEPMYILFTKKTLNAQDIVNRFDKGLKMLKKSGEYDEIIAGSLVAK